MPSIRRPARGTGSAIGVAALALLAALLATPAAVHAQVVAPDVDLEITRREIVADGHRFGRGGVYEKLVGTMTVALEPDDPRNAVIVDLEHAPTNADGMVEYDTDFYLLRPLDLRRWNGKLFFEVNNRGNKISIRSVNSAPANNDPTSREDFGTGYLLNEGYAIAWAGWEADVLPGDDRMTIRVPVPTQEDGSPITDQIVVEFRETFAPDGSTACLPLSGSDAFASYPAVVGAPAELRVRPSDSPRPPSPEIPAGEVVPDDAWEFASDTEICLDGGFRLGNVYELFYTARDPRLMGLGYAATRDVVSFLRYAGRDSDGDANPLVGPRGGVETALGQGISSSGMYMRDFLYQGFNEDLAGRPVFDGVNIHIPGAHKLFLNYRFAQPNPYSTQHRDRFMPYVGFPFNYGVREDPLSGRVDGILKRPATDPLVIHTDTATEYWQFQGALVNTDGFGNDVALPDSVRQYLLSGTDHGSGSPATTPTYGECQQLNNPVHVGPLLRAVVANLDGWATRGTPPPDSRAPTVADGTLVEVADLDFPEIPGVVFNGNYNDAGERDFGPRVEGNAGIIDDWRHADVVADYDVLVPAVDEVGIDLGGLELPEVAAPTATLTGWNLYADPWTDGDLCRLNGMVVPLPETATAGDERPSLEELYGSHAGYVAAVARASTELVRDRLLLPRDAAQAIRDAARSDVLR